MTLHIGFDPGGTGRKLAHMTAALDDDDRLFVGHLRAPAAFGNPAVQFSLFPYVDGQTRRAIEGQLRAALTSLLGSLGVSPAPDEDPLAFSLAHFGAVIVSVDAPSGFAMTGNSVRHTESAVGANFNTPDERTFLSSAMTWLGAGNMTPLRQRVFWKLIGFVIYGYFTGASSAAALARAASREIGADLKVSGATSSGVTIFESFPSETYRVMTVPTAATTLAHRFAARTPMNLAAAPLSPATFAAFRARLEQVARGVPGAWTRTRGRRVGDCLDAFASMMLGPWSQAGALRACGTSLPHLSAEGAIVLPG